MSAGLNSLGLSSLNQSMGSSRSSAASRHRRHQSDPFGSSLAPMSDSDMAAFLTAEGDEDAFLPGSMLSFDDADLGEIGDLLVPTPSSQTHALPNWPSPRTPGRKHRRTISEPALGFQFVKNDVHTAPVPAPLRRGASAELYDDATHPLILSGELRLDSFDLELDERAVPPMPPPPMPPLFPAPARAARSTGRRRRPPRSADEDFVDPDAVASVSPAPRRSSKSSDAASETKKYRCSRCGQIKNGHVCPFLKYNSVAVATQADPTVTVTTDGCRTLSVRGRFVGAAVMA